MKIFKLPTIYRKQFLKTNAWEFKNHIIIQLCVMCTYAFQPLVQYRNKICVDQEHTLCVGLGPPEYLPWLPLSIRPLPVCTPYWQCVRSAKQPSNTLLCLLYHHPYPHKGCLSKSNNKNCTIY